MIIEICTTIGRHSSTVIKYVITRKFTENQKVLFKSR